MAPCPRRRDASSRCTGLAKREVRQLHWLVGQPRYGRVSRFSNHGRENGLEKRAHLGKLLDPDDQIPCWFELLPSCAVEEVFQRVFRRTVGRGGLEDGTPAIERFVGPVVAALQLLRRKPYWAIDH